ncbi:MAG: hydrogenase maturation protease [Planctomycetes bacterium]|nr:hydrogenase maturation protease [Planctomycetota bacterium]
MRARVIGLGQSAAGDDGVGVAVVHAFREHGPPSGVEIHHLRDPSALAALLDANVPVVIVDAVLGSPSGAVVELTPEDLATRAPLRVSSHGLGITEAIGLARVLNAGADLPVIRIVAVTIARPIGYQDGLSAEVAAAVPRAAERVLQILGVDHA